MILQTLVGTVFITILWRRLGTWIRAYFVRTTLALYEYDEIGKKRPDGKMKGTAVIAGGSVGGLWAARFASEHFEEVVVVEPESWTLDEAGVTPRWDEAGTPLDPEPEPKRSRVFQYRGPHAFQAFHALTLSKAFPDFEEEARRENIVLGKCFVPIAVHGVLTSPPTEYYPDTGLPKTIFASRPAYERLLRRLVRNNCKNVRWIKGAVTGIVPSAVDRRQISGVVIDLADGDGNVHQKAALVVDATGASASGLKWLKDQSYGQKKQTKTDLTFDNFRMGYDPKMRYRCMEWSIPEGLEHKLPSIMGYKDTGVFYAYFPDSRVENRFANCFRVEGRRMHVALGGWDVAFAELPKTPSELIQWIKSIRGVEPIAPWVISIYEMLNAANGFSPTDEIASTDYRSPASSYLRYHRVSDLPSNFVALGDAVMKVNPVWGQGCMKALLGALTLHSLLLHTPVHHSEKAEQVLPLGFAKRFFALQAPKIEVIYDSTKTPDYGWSTTTPAEGETHANGWFIRAYLNNMLHLRHYDREVNQLLSLNYHFLAPATDLFSPRILLKVAWYALTSPFYKRTVPQKYAIEIKPVVAAT